MAQDVHDLFSNNGEFMPVVMIQVQDKVLLLDTTVGQGGSFVGSRAIEILLAALTVVVVSNT